MTMTAYSSAIVDAMLGWLKGLANWVLRLFNLAGSAETSPILWMSQNWLKLLIILMIIGVAGDVLVWLVRWRPHWVWFRKERVIVDDDRFFDQADVQGELESDDDNLLERNWDERDYVVASTLVTRQKSDRKKQPERTPTRKDARTKASFKRGERRGKPGMADSTDVFNTKRQADAGDALDQALFDVDGNRTGVTDYYEDEVFNVNNLPEPAEAPAANEEA